MFKVKSTLSQFSKFIQYLENQDILKEDETIKKINSGYLLENERFSLYFDKNPWLSEGIFDIVIDNIKNSYQFEDIIKSHFMTITEVLEKKTFVNDTLNPDIWNKDKSNYSLDKNIKKGLDNILEHFIDFLDLPKLKYSDVVITGSNANYNWSKESDLDIHIIVNMRELSKEYGKLVKEYCNLKRQLFNNLHDIRIKGYNVELYVEDKEEVHVSSGIYSLKDQKWSIFPTKKDIKVDSKLVDMKVKEYKKIIDQMCDGINTNPENIQKTVDRLKQMRKTGLEKSGEYSIENLAYKELRRDGYLEKLFNCKYASVSSMLSIEEEEEWSNI